VSVGSGATLGGSGAIGGLTSILAGGILSPGTSPGTLAVNNTLALDGGSFLAFEIDAGDPSSSVLNDLITGVTDLTLGGTLNLTGTGDFTTVTQGNTWRLINYAGSLTDNGLAIGTAPTLAAGLSFAVDTSTANEVNLVVVPEPASLAAAMAGLVAVAAAYRQRRTAGPA
jgi:fibronectin-binding autotransporter adhesin